tara:strand:- start:19 stop:2001 length:1983 start_codon:yes stop_codon:yes gene_type:complete
MSRQGVQYAGEVEFLEVMITSPDGQSVRLDANNDVTITEINVFEDMFRHSLTGNLLITDTKEFINKFPIVGQERLTMKIKTPSPEIKKEDIFEGEIFDFIERRFVINKVQSRDGIASGAQFYELKFISEHALVNSTKKISKSYVNSKSNIGEMVEDLLKNELGLPQDKIFVEPTLGSRSMLMQNINPHTFIQNLTKEAISKEDGSPNYVYYENKNGVFFRTLQHMYKQQSRGQFHFGDKATDEEYDGKDVDSGKVIQSYRRILDMSLINGHDLLLNAHAGMMGGNVIEQNFYHKRLETKKYNYLDDKYYKRYDRIEGGISERVYTADSLGDASPDDIENTNTSVIPISKSSDMDMSFELKKTPNKRVDTILERQSRFLELTEGLKIKMDTHGYTGVAVGDVITVNVNTIGGDDNDGNIVKFYSGDYLIKELRHTFSPPVKTHVMTMVVVKDGLAESNSQGESTRPSGANTTQSSESVKATPSGETSNYPDSKKGKLGRRLSQQKLEDDPEFQAKLAEMEKKYPGQGFSKQKLYNTIKGESAFDTGARNKNTNASGLFQFTQPALDDINKKFGTNHTLQGVRGMSATDQLGVYDQYLDRWNYSGSNELGVMQGAPAYANRSLSTVVYRAGSKQWEQNPGWRPTSGGDITVADMNNYYAKQA